MDRHALILAGGLSRRFGSDKTRLHRDGEWLLASMVQRLGQAGFSATLLGPALPYFASLGIPILEDLAPYEGPLHALYGACVRLSSARFLVVAADMPFATPTVYERLWKVGAEALATHIEGSPLPGVYARSLAPRIRRLLSRCRCSLRALLDTIDPPDRRVIPPSQWQRWDPTGAALININTPTDWTELPCENISGA